MNTRNSVSPEGPRIIHVAPATLEAFLAVRNPWSESEEEIEAAFEWARRKRALLRWLRRQLGERLTPRERHCLELHYFRGFNFTQIGKRTGTDPSAAFRAVQRAVTKLRIASEEDPSWREKKPRKKASTIRG